MLLELKLMFCKSMKISPYHYHCQDNEIGAAMRLKIRVNYPFLNVKNLPSLPRPHPESRKWLSVMLKIDNCCEVGLDRLVKSDASVGECSFTLSFALIFLLYFSFSLFIIQRKSYLHII